MPHTLESSRVTEEAYLAAIDFAKENNQGLPLQGLSFIESAITNACVLTVNPTTLKDHNEAAAYVAGIIDSAKFDFPQEDTFRNFVGASKNFARRVTSFEAGRRFYSEHKFSANAKSLIVIIDAYAKICEKLGVEDEINTIKSGGMSLQHA